jgi:hypothetical protein
MERFEELPVGQWTTAGHPPFSQIGKDGHANAVARCDRLHGLERTQVRAREHGRHRLVR